MLQFELKQLIQKLLKDLIILARRVGQAESFKLNCRKMRMQVYLLSQMLKVLLVFITLDPNLSYLNPMNSVIMEVSNTLQEALTLACTCKRKTILSQLFAGTKANYFHKLYHLLDLSIAKMNWLFILYNPDVGSALDDIFLISLHQILTNDPSILSAWSSTITQKMIWELATMLAGAASPIGLKICCVEALSMLNVGRVLNSRMIKETKLLMLGLAKLAEGEHSELQRNYLMTTMEITAAAESDLGLRCKAFKANSPSAKAIVELLLRVIKESEDPPLQVLAIRSIGSLARIFSERKNHNVISVLVLQLRNKHREVAMEAVMALQKFACPSNYLHKAHSKRMIEFNAVQPLVKLLRESEETEQVEGLMLICYLGMNVDYSEAMEEARVVTLIQELTGKRGGLSISRSRTVASQHPELKQLVSKALRSLHLYYKY